MSYEINEADATLNGNAIYRAGGTDIPVADGGTGASTAAAARTGLGIGTADTPTFAGITITGDTVIATETPATAAATGTAGQIAWDADYIYICTATDTWKRVAIATW